VKFGAIALEDAEGAVLAHAVKSGNLALKKGTVLGAQELAALRQAGIFSVVAARMEAGDLSENMAAQRIAERLAGHGIRVEQPATGRCNLFAEKAGVLRIDVSAVNALNAVDEAVTVATLPDLKAVVAGEMVGTVKIIPFAVPEAVVARIEALAAGALAVAPYTPKRVLVVSTRLPGLKETVINKTIGVMDDRLAQAGSRREGDIRVEHEVGALAAALAKASDGPYDLIVVFGSSAIADRGDVIPAALEAAGGQVVHFGMPVDPGNLLLLGTLNGKPVIGAPGCARSPRENGFDWVLQRQLANVPVTRQDIQGMGVGGLLMEIVSRPHPREQDSGAAAPATDTKLKIVLLAAGRSTRMGNTNKLTILYRGKPLVRHVAEAAVAAGIGEVIVVTGHDAEAVAEAIEGLPVRIIHNPRFAEGFSTSLLTGVHAAGEDVGGVVVALGDMPMVPSPVFRRLAAVFAEHPEAKAVVPTFLGERGNPVLIGRSLFGALQSLQGDVGARRLIEAAGQDVVEVPVDDAGVQRDFDTPEALQSLVRSESQTP
jgi:molybdenum cofactor cytidylyltransferase